MSFHFQVAVFHFQIEIFHVQSWTFHSISYSTRESPGVSNNKGCFSSPKLVLLLIFSSKKMMDLNFLINKKRVAKSLRFATPFICNSIFYHRNSDFGNTKKCYLFASYFSFKASSTCLGTNSDMFPPYLATSLTMLELKNEY